MATPGWVCQTPAVADTGRTAQGSGGEENPPAASDPIDSGGHLPDDAVVIRGGQMRRRQDLIDAAETCQEKLGFPGLSVYSWPTARSAGEVAFRVKAVRDRTGKKILMNGDLRKSTAGRIRNAGTAKRHPFSLVKTGEDEEHYTLRLPSPTTSRDWDLLDQIFDGPEINPVGLKANYGD
jgi:hypothetical protein